MSWVGEQLMTLDFRKLGDFRKFHEILGLMANTQPATQKAKFSNYTRNLQKVKGKTFHRQT